MQEKKYPNWKGSDNEGRVEALLNIIGEPNAEGLLTDEIEVEFRPSSKLRFDRNSRRIPARGLTAKVCDPDTDFHLDRPSVKLGQELARLQSFFPVGTKFVPEKEFLERIAAAVDRVQHDKQIANILNGPYFPVCLPQFVFSKDIADLGGFIEMCVESAGRSYRDQFSERQFYNHRRGTLAGQVKIVEATHQLLVEKLSKRPLVGILTVPLQGFSVHAQREQMDGLPDFMSLAGLEFAVGMTAYPQNLARDFHTPGLDLSPYQWQDAQVSLSFKAFDAKLVFGNEGVLDAASAYYSGGLFVLA